jgi:hypothetical protein
LQSSDAELAIIVGFWVLFHFACWTEPVGVGFHTREDRHDHGPRPSTSFGRNKGQQAFGGSTGVVGHDGETGFRTDASDNVAQFPARRSLGLGMEVDTMRYTLFKMIRSEIGRIRAQRLNFRSTNI